MNGDENNSEKPKRRVRYKGTHPRRFEEKYKELNPEKYANEIEKVKGRGQTPAGQHRPICLNEILQILNPQPGQIMLDATLGYGGHSGALLEKIQPGGKLIALDQDPIERPKTEERLRVLFPAADLLVGGINFAEAWNFLRQSGVGKVDGVLADLGLSSMQMDTPDRGFSFKVEAPFDLRMNPETGASGADLLASVEVTELEDILRDNADELYARQIAQQLVRDKPQLTTQVAESVRKALGSQKDETKVNDSVRRVFQAVRIAVNDEYGALEKFLEDLPRTLKRGGRVAILSFHSGEDRRVKKAFQEGLRNGVFSAIAPEPVRATPEEQRSNPRSKSAKLRWARV